MLHRFRFVVIIASVCGGCASTVRIELMKPIPTGCPASRNGNAGHGTPPRFRAVTFNAAMAPGVHRLVPQRQSVFVGQLQREVARSDLVCLEEVWTPEARQAVRTALRGQNVRIVESDTRGLQEDPQDRCSPGDLDGLMGCVQKNCGHEDPIDLAICARRACYWKLAWLYLWHRHCLNCLVSSVGKPKDGIIRTCVNGPGASRAYGGDNGLMMISRRPLRNPEVRLVPASGSNRVVLMASVEVAPGKEIEVGCMHISSKLESSPTDYRFKSWAEEQAAQLQIASRRLQARAQGRPQLLIGDMNFGQKHPPTVGQVMWPSWKRACQAGFVSPGEYAVPPLCSYCRGNLLSGAGASVLIDHVLLRQGRVGWSLQPSCAENLFDQPIEVIDRHGRKVRTHVSDHYGIAVDFEVIGR